AASFFSLLPTFTFLSGFTWLILCLISPVFSQVCSDFLKNGSVKSSDHMVEYFTPALVSEPLRFSMPTSPGQVPDQLATVRIGPRCVARPERTWWLYCQTHSATINGASGSM